MPLRPYDGTVIDPFWVDIAGRGDWNFAPGFYMACRRASPIFQLGDWRRRRREAEERNDFRALDRLDQEYERIGM